MSNCLTGLSQGCDGTGNIAGIAELYLTRKNQIASWTFNVSGQITGIVMVDVADTFAKFEFDEDTAYLNQTMTVKNGNTNVKQAIKFNNAKMDTTKRNAIMTLVSCSTCGVVGLVKDNNSKWWVVGILKDPDSESNDVIYRSLKVVSGSGNTGADSENDYNGFETMLEAKNGEYAREWTLGVDGIPVD